MAAKYYTILTDIGKSKLANAAALGRQINLTHIAVGDGNGTEYDPVESQTDLKNENYRTPISHLGTDAQNPNWVIAEGMIPVDTGGWFVREVGVYDEDGDLFAVGKYPETYKPTLAEGTGRDLYVRFIMVVSNTETINLKIDPTVAIATRGFVEDVSNGVAERSCLHEHMVMAAANRNKPNIQPLFDEKIRSCLNTPFRKVHPFEVGGADIVMKNVKTFRGDKYESFPIMYFEHDNEAGKSYTYEVEVTLHDGLTHDNVHVEFLAYDDFGQWVEIVDFSRNENLYVTTRTSSGARNHFGFRIYYQAEQGHMSVNGIKINDGEKELIDFSEMKSNISQSCIHRYGNTTGPLIVQQFNDVKIAHNGILNGVSPRILWASPDGDEFSTNATDSFLKGGEVGTTIDKTLTPLYALQWQRTLKANGFESPLVVLRAGEYVMEGLSTSPLWFAHRSSDESMVVCLDGEATFKGLNSSIDGIYASTSEPEESWPSVYVANITFDSDVSRPIIAKGVNFFGLNIKGFYGSVDIFDMDNCNFTLQRCHAEGADNDGFNHHGFGHGILIDCIGQNNFDDGFSPHDDCTYEVWGGKYLNNGKGNIIPAFGAQGFCVGVNSAGSTGLSDRVQPGNDGGFVSLCRGSTTRPTVMYCIDCESDGDTIGYNSAGANSFLYVVNSASLNATLSGTANSAWETSSPGYLNLVGHKYSGNATSDSIGDPDKFQKVSL